MNRKKKTDGTPYKDYFFYACKHRRMVDGHACTYRRQWSEEKIDAAVAEVIRKLVCNQRFADAIKEKINARIDTDELDRELEVHRKQLKQVIGAKNKLTAQMDTIDITDRNYNRKYQDMQDRLDRSYDQIGEIEDRITETETHIHNLHQQKITGDNVYKYLLYFDRLYDKMTDMEKKQFLHSFVSEVQIFEKEQPDGQILKHIQFAFPVFYEGKEITALGWDNETTVETSLMLQRLRDQIIVKENVQ